MEAISALLALCAGNSPVTGEFPSQRPVTRGFDVFSLRRNLRRHHYYVIVMSSIVVDVAACMAYGIAWHTVNNVSLWSRMKGFVKKEHSRATQYQWKQLAKCLKSNQNVSRTDMLSHFILICVTGIQNTQIRLKHTPIAQFARHGDL